MNISACTDLYNLLRNDRLSLVYRGVAGDEMTQSLIMAGEANIGLSGSAPNISRKVSFLMLECFQNLVRHRQDESSGAPAGFQEMFATRDTGRLFLISSVNVIEAEKVAGLTGKLERINELNPDELKNLFREVLSSPEYTEKGGAGLGMIEMARKSGRKLQFSFRKLDEKHVAFYFQATKTSGGDEESAEHTLDDVEAIYSRMTAEGLSFIYKGDFSMETVFPLIKMHEQGVSRSGEVGTIPKNLSQLLIEVVQNISMHARETEGRRDGLLLIGAQDNRVAICSGNVIDHGRADELMSQLGSLEKLDKEQLRKLFRESLSGKEERPDGAPGLGLIDIFRNSTEVTHSYRRLDDRSGFFALRIVA